MTRNGYPYFLARSLLELIGYFIGNRRVLALLHVFLKLFLAHLGLLLAYRTLGNSKDGKGTSPLNPQVYRINDLIHVIRYLGNKDNIGTAGYSGIKCEPSNLVSHNFDNEHASV